MNRIGLLVINDADERTRLERELDAPDDQWIIKYSANGLEALGIIGNGKIDVVLADLELTRMSGYELLEKVRASFPDVVRILISDFPREEKSPQALQLVHQFLPLPLDTDKLSTTLERAFLIRSMLEKSALREILADLSSLPPMPSLYMSLVEALAGSDAPIATISDIVSGDTAIATSILETVNSSFFGLSRTVQSPSHAVSLMGLDMIKAIVLSLEVISEFETTELPGDFTMETLWKHGMETGAVARRIAMAEGVARETSDMAMAAGLLHDQGKLIMAENLGERYGETLRAAEADNGSLFDAETRFFGVSHAEIGGYVLGMWGMPKPLVEAIRYHHEPAEAQVYKFSVLTAVHVADALVHELAGDVSMHGITEPDMEYLRSFDADSRLLEWRRIAEAVMEEEKLVKQ